MARLLRGLRRDAPLTFDDVTLPQSYLVRRFHEQQAALAATPPAASRP
jgi:hypothetical protein